MCGHRYEQLAAAGFAVKGGADGGEVFLERRVTRRTRTAAKATGSTSKARGTGAGSGKSAGAQAATQPLTVLTGQGLQGVGAGGSVGSCEGKCGEQVWQGSCLGLHLA